MELMIWGEEGWCLVQSRVARFPTKNHLCLPAVSRTGGRQEWDVSRSTLGPFLPTRPSPPSLGGQRALTYCLSLVKSTSGKVSNKYILLEMSELCRTVPGRCIL